MKRAIRRHPLLPRPGRRDQGAEGVAARVEAGELVPAGAGRREQHDGAAAGAGGPASGLHRGLAACRRCGAGRHARPASPRAPARRGRSAAPGRCAGKRAPGGSIPPALAVAAGDPDQPVVARQRAAALSALVALLSLTKATPRDRADPLLPMRQAGVGASPAAIAARSGRPAPAPAPRRRPRSARCARRAGRGVGRSSDRRRRRRAARRPRTRRRRLRRPAPRSAPRGRPGARAARLGRRRCRSRRGRRGLLAKMRALAAA